MGEKSGRKRREGGRVECWERSAPRAHSCVMLKGVGGEENRERRETGGDGVVGVGASQTGRSGTRSRVVAEEGWQAKGGGSRGRVVVEGGW